MAGKFPRFCLIGVVMGGMASIAAGRATAAFTVFADRASFNAAVDGAPLLVKDVQTFDTIPAGEVIANGSELDGVVYDSSVGMSIVTDLFTPLSAPNTLGRTNQQFFDASDVLTLTFTTPVLAFGISFNTAATGEGAYTVTTNLGDVAPSFYDPFPGLTTGQFAGFLSDTPLTSVTITGPGGEAYTLDDLTIASVVPEPSSMAMVLVGVLALGGIAWRRRSA